MNNIEMIYNEKVIKFDDLHLDSLFSHEKIIKDNREIIKIEVQSNLESLLSLSDAITDDIIAVSVRGIDMWRKSDRDGVGVVTSIGTNGCISGDKALANDHMKLSIEIYILKEVDHKNEIF